MVISTRAADSVQLASDIDWGQQASDWIKKVGDFGLKFLGFLAILIVGLIVAKIVLKAVNSILERVGFDKLVERGGVKQALARSNYDASDIVAKLAYYAVLLLVLMMAFNVFGANNPVSEMLSSVVRYLPNIIVAIIIIVVASAVAKAVKDMVSTLLSSTNFGNILATAASVAIMVFGVLGALSQLNIMPVITSTVVIGLIATVSGILIVGVGGGLVLPMSRVWQEWIEKVRTNAPDVKAQAAASARQAGGDDPLRGYVASQSPTEE